MVRKDLPPVTTVMGDQSYDSKRLDRKRHKIETLFSRQKDWRRIITRYDRCAHVFRSAILLAAIVLFW